MTPEIFQQQFSLIYHRYPTRYSANSYKIPKTFLRKTDFLITCRGPRVWNNLLDKNLKSITSLNLFKKSIKPLLLGLIREKEYF